MKPQNAFALARGPLTGIWHRGVRRVYLSNPLAYAHTATVPGRFNGGTPARPAHHVLYLGESTTVALYEVRAMLGSPLPGMTSAQASNFGQWVVLPIAVRLQQVADLTRGRQRSVIDTTVQELTGDWRGYAHRAGRAAFVRRSVPSAPTQLLGAACHAVARFEGFVAWSAQVPTERTFVVFPDKLLPGSELRYTDPATGQVVTVP